MSKCKRFVGLDDSKATISVAVADEGRDGEIRRFGTIENSPEALKKLVRRLGRPKSLYFVYEAGPGGYGIYRELLALGAHCIVAAPTLTPKRSGDQIKTDPRDAESLARLHRAGELVPIWVPDTDTEAMRDLTRAREDAKYAQTKARQRLQSFLLRHGRRYPGRSPWTRMHLRWLAEQRFEHPSQQISFDEYVGSIEETTARVARFDSQILELIDSWSQSHVVRALATHRGVSYLTAATLVAEIGDLTRFDRAQDIMGFVGLVPSLYASGQRSLSGSITKTGNSHARRVLVEAAWAYRHPARRTTVLRRRLEGQPEEVQRISWRAQVRLCGRYRRLRARGKQHNKTVVAIARELTGFLWATARAAQIVQ